MSARALCLTFVLLGIVLFRAAASASPADVSRVSPPMAQANLNPSDMPHPAGEPPSRAWLDEFGVWALVGVSGVLVFMAIAGWLVFRWGGTTPRVDREATPETPAPRPTFDRFGARHK